MKPDWLTKELYSLNPRLKNFLPRLRKCTEVSSGKQNRADGKYYISEISTKKKNREEKETYAYQR